MRQLLLRGLEKDASKERNANLSGQCSSSRSYVVPRQVARRAFDLHRRGLHRAGTRRMSRANPPL